jgi:hypothetical protein
MTFEELAIRTEGLSNEFYLQCFISGLKEAIKAHVNMHHSTTWLHACKLSRETKTILQASSLKAQFTTHPRPWATLSPTKTLKVKKVGIILRMEIYFVMSNPW